MNKKDLLELLKDGLVLNGYSTTVFDESIQETVPVICITIKFDDEIITEDEIYI